MQVFSQNETWLSEVTGFFPLVYIIFPINKYWVLDNLSVKCTLDNSWITSLDTDIDCLSFIDDWSQKRLLLDWWFEPRIVTTAVYGRTRVTRCSCSRCTVDNVHDRPAPVNRWWGPVGRFGSAGFSYVHCTLGVFGAPWINFGLKWKCWPNWQEKS